MQILFVLFTFVAGSLGLEVSPGETAHFELKIGTVTALGSIDFEPDYCIPTFVTASQTNTDQDYISATHDTQGSATLTSMPILESTKTLTQTISKTISQTVLVTILSSGPILPGTLITALPGTAPVNGTRNGTVPFTFGSPPTPTFDTTMSISGGRKQLTQQAWCSFITLVICLCLM
ncbi:hypothetical protein F5Y13DRAFT_102693 [Hypoxylon sp. FL1857]|nr:hypothetical protein F5Y13DRAFT_102693 [Hypoxylon sp. FL1857]